jgi:Predicted endonuclease distantly related to archaeal Holliday junction resolvase
VTGAGPLERDSRRRAERRGRRAELLAALALSLKGYRILAWRYRAPYGEVDLIVRRGDTIAFVEVKARAETRAGVDAVPFEAQRRIAAAGEHFLSRRRDFARLSWRNDVVVVRPWRWPIHFEEAF